MRAFAATAAVLAAVMVAAAVGLALAAGSRSEPLRGYFHKRDSRVVEIFYGTDYCHRLDRVRVREGRRRVAVRVVTRREAEVCAQVVVVGVVRARLRAAVGRRAVVDAARGKRVPRLSAQQAARLRSVARSR